MGFDIEPGAELNMAVANAIGVRPWVVPECDKLSDCMVLITSREWDEMRGIEHPTCEGDIPTVPFQPSTDLNAAFAAAGVVGLFDEWSIGQASDGVRSHWVIEGSYESGLCTGPTAALAICKAILMLKGVKS